MSEIKHPIEQKNYHLAQVNISRMLAPLTDPIMAEFVANLEAINSEADTSPGFVWRLQNENGNATDIRLSDDELILVNLSVWESLEALSKYVYRSQHGEIMRKRRSWFEHSNQPLFALWWIEAGQIPTVEEAKQRLEYLRKHGSTSYAFSFAKPFPRPDII
ncbi:hypothetical protein NIES4071_96840 [Calothrix sp. NIES-4071]|nr:hypothetical protein NIES4071_96840 [Calothrix sp. NIES-4071]BAZ63949.1 hypothetical protein NIES4105_96770 [Calothrix sp. NIES-4105]